MNARFEPLPYIAFNPFTSQLTIMNWDNVRFINKRRGEKVLKKLLEEVIGQPVGATPYLVNQLNQELKELLEKEAWKGELFVKIRVD